MKQYHLNKLSPELGAEISGIDLSISRNSNLQKALVRLKKKLWFPHPVYPHVDNFLKLFY